ncbi:hypothetical protein BDP27DRAFT_1351786 [Rhodocollybia butyracea]|uniref:Restriction of telomere capping protein 4 C-terminal domain-containing protein n=1 Tax=Rhodocollybia butyracea TaxID=206335 RepID=A0A9P5P1F8_9AGAR|nr:hypothetical protein BDP27DRAFT_1351786 [Rhodocollybia butyracea]
MPLNIKHKIRSSAHKDAVLVVKASKTKLVEQAQEKKKKKHKLIPKPTGKIGRAGLQLVNAMGLGENHARYYRLRRIAISLAEQYLDFDKTFAQQNAIRLEKTILEAAKAYSFFEKYEHGWATREIIRTHMANAVPRLRKSKKEERAAERMDCKRIPEKDRDEAGGAVALADFESEDERPRRKAPISKEVNESEDEEGEVSRGWKQGQGGKEANKRDKPQQMPRPLLPRKSFETPKPKRPLVKTPRRSTLTRKPKEAPVATKVTPFKTPKKTSRPSRTAGERARTAVLAHLDQEDEDEGGSSDAYVQSNDDETPVKKPLQGESTFPVSAITSSPRIRSLPPIPQAPSDSSSESDDERIVSWPSAFQVCGWCDDPVPEDVPHAVAKLAIERDGYIRKDGFYGVRARRMDISLCGMIRKLSEDDPYSYTNRIMNTEWYDTAMNPDFEGIPSRILGMKEALSMLVGDREFFTRHQIYQYLFEEFGPTVNDVYRKFCRDPFAQAGFASEYLGTGYLGPYGLHIISEVLIRMFPGKTLDKKTTEPFDHAQVHQFILAPFVLAKLAQEDVGVSLDYAWPILRDSTRFGEYQYPDEDLPPAIRHLQESFEERLDVEAEEQDLVPQGKKPLRPASPKKPKAKKPKATTATTPFPPELKEKVDPMRRQQPTITAFFSRQSGAEGEATPKHVSLHEPKGSSSALPTKDVSNAAALLKSKVSQSVYGRAGVVSAPLPKPIKPAQSFSKNTTASESLSTSKQANVAPASKAIKNANSQAALPIDYEDEENFDTTQFDKQVHFQVHPKQKRKGTPLPLKPYTARLTVDNFPMPFRVIMPPLEKRKARPEEEEEGAQTKHKKAKKTPDMVNDNVAVSKSGRPLRNRKAPTIFSPQVSVRKTRAKTAKNKALPRSLHLG